MIDFQLSRYASPALDIAFFIYSCTTEELRAQYYDDLLKTYHDNLCEIVKDFGSNPEFLFPFSALEVSFNFNFFHISIKFNYYVIFRAK